MIVGAATISAGDEQHEQQERGVASARRRRRRRRRVVVDSSSSRLRGVVVAGHRGGEFAASRAGHESARILGSRAERGVLGEIALQRLSPRSLTSGLSWRRGPEEFAGVEKGDDLLDRVQALALDGFGRVERVVRRADDVVAAGELRARQHFGVVGRLRARAEGDGQRRFVVVHVEADAAELAGLERRQQRASTG